MARGESEYKEPDYAVVPRVSKTGQAVRAPTLPDGSLEGLLAVKLDTQAGSILGAPPVSLPFPNIQEDVPG